MRKYLTSLYIESLFSNRPPGFIDVSKASFLAMGFLPALSGLGSTSVRAGLLVRGGSIPSVIGGAAVDVAATASSSSSSLPSLPTITQPKTLAVIYMAISMALHFFGYEFARSATLTLFTSKTTGFSSLSSLPLALACVCPASLCLLYVYTACLERYGPRNALRYTSLFCAFVLLGLSTIINSYKKFFIAERAVKYVVGVLFVFRCVLACLRAYMRV